MLHDPRSRFGDNEGEGWSFVTPEQLKKITDGELVAVAPQDDFGSNYRGDDAPEKSNDGLQAHDA